jgi:DNA-binding NarL/FixJ family response regulator
MTTRKTRLYLADDHPIVIDGLKEVLKSKPNLEVSGIANNGRALTELIKKEVPDVAIIDINMPIMNGLECTAWIKENYPEVKVLILTMYPEKAYINQLMNVGADGCLLKSRGTNDLIDAIERVVGGQSYFDWISDFRQERTAKELRISSRELEIIKMILDGKTTNEIAEAINVSENTVKTHRKNIFKKLNIHNSAELLNFSIANKLIKGI